MLSQPILLLFSLLSLAYCDNSTQTTVSLLLLNTDPQSLVASIVAADTSATTYIVSCPSGTPDEDCGYIADKPITVIGGPSTAAAQFTVTAPSTNIWDWECTLPTVSATTATCGQTSIGNNGTESMTGTFGSTDIIYFPVVVTAGIEKLNVVEAKTTSTSEATSNGIVAHGASSTATATHSSHSSTPASSKKPTSTGASNSTSTGSAALNVVNLSGAAIGLAGAFLAVL